MKRCDHCFESAYGWWCDSCGGWPCICPLGVPVRPMYCYQCGKLLTEELTCPQGCII